jgi:hypothetical protein
VCLELGLIQAVLMSLMCSALASVEYGVCFVDTATGHFHLGQFSDDRQKCARLVLHSARLLNVGFSSSFTGHVCGRCSLSFGQRSWCVLR